MDLLTTVFYVLSPSAQYHDWIIMTDAKLLCVVQTAWKYFLQKLLCKTHVHVCIIIKVDFTRKKTNHTVAKDLEWLWSQQVIETSTHSTTV